MPNEASHSKSNSRAVRCLEPFNQSPMSEEDQVRGSRSKGSRYSSGKTARSNRERSKSRSRLESRSRSQQSPSEPPQWAKDVL